MACSLTESRVKKSAQGLILSYELPHRTYAVSGYPIESSNGSTIIIYGHENGVRIIWRGGKRFRLDQQETPVPHTENGGSNTIMLIDSDDEAAVTPENIEAKFSDEEEDYDPSLQYPEIRQYLDLNFGTGALHLAAPSPLILKSDEFSSRNQIIFVAACSDLSIRLITLPLTPPSPASKTRPEFRTEYISANAGYGKWGEKMVTLNGHARPSDGVSITVDNSNSDPFYIVASHSREVNGRLSLWRCPFNSQSSHIEPFQTINLASPAKKISFNPSISNSSYLLVAEATGACRIYDYNVSRLQSGPSDALASTQGNWLLSLFTGFRANKTEFPAGVQARSARKNINDAQWISNGRAIIVLLDDGEWGVWDIESCGLGVSQSLLNFPDIKGGSISKYSFNGFIHSSHKPHTMDGLQTNSKYAPITPGTRKSIDPFVTQSTGIVPGQISVLQMPTSTSTIHIDEAVLLRVGETNALIPSMTKFSTTYGGKDVPSSLFGGDSGGRIIILTGADLQGEHCSAVTLIPSKRGKMGSALLPDVVFMGEHRFLILNSNKFPARLSLGRSTSNDNAADSTNIVQNGGLGVQEIEMALDLMHERNGAGIDRNIPVS